MTELANRVVALDALWASDAGELAARLDAARSWPERFGELEAVLAHRLDPAPPSSTLVLGAWARLRATHGAVPVQELADELGCSRQHLAALFREQIGLPPKTVARVLRFSRAVCLAGTDARLGWAEIAHACGYADQAHLGNDFRRLAGMTPGDVARTRPPILDPVSAG